MIEPKVNTAIEVQAARTVATEISSIDLRLGEVDRKAENAAMLMIPFTLGETVKVINGPFSTFDATIEKINEEKQKLEVTVKIFGRKTPVELGFTEVEKL